MRDGWRHDQKHHSTRSGWKVIEEGLNAKGNGRSVRRLIRRRDESQRGFRPASHHAARGVRRSAKALAQFAELDERQNHACAHQRDEAAGRPYHVAPLLKRRVPKVY